MQLLVAPLRRTPFAAPAEAHPGPADPFLFESVDLVCLWRTVVCATGAPAVTGRGTGILEHDLHGHDLLAYTECLRDGLLSRSGDPCDRHHHDRGLAAGLSGTCPISRAFSAR